MLKWPPTDLYALPSELEIQRVKEDISCLQEELLDAQRKVAKLEQAIIERKVWIAPIRRVPHDILSQVFLDLCAENWRAPLVLQGVCRQWRGYLYHTPLAWSFLTVFSRKAKLHKRRVKPSPDLVRIFLERSGCAPLHIRLLGDDPSDDTGQLTAIKSRIKCLWMEHWAINWFMQEGDTFINLHTLNIDVYRDVTSLIDHQDQYDQFKLDNTHFPHLQILGVIIETNIRLANSIVSGIAFSPKLPPLRELTMDCTSANSDFLGVILSKCSASLELVDLTFDTVGQSLAIWDPEKEHFFPKLIQLRLHNTSSYRAALGWGFKAVAPKLEVYLEVGEIGSSTGRTINTEAIRILETPILPELSRYPNLEILRFNWNFSFLSEQISKLGINPSLCPNLTCIFYKPPKRSLRLHPNALAGTADGQAVLEALKGRAAVTGKSIEIEDIAYSAPQALKRISLVSRWIYYRLFADQEPVWRTCIMGAISEINSVNEGEA